MVDFVCSKCSLNHCWLSSLSKRVASQGINIDVVARLMKRSEESETGCRNGITRPTGSPHYMSKQSLDHRPTCHVARAARLFVTASDAGPVGSCPHSQRRDDARKSPGRCADLSATQCFFVSFATRYPNSPRRTQGLQTTPLALSTRIFGAVTSP
jgi:hypothetical protein